MIYCDDAGKGVVETLQKYDDESLPINIGFNEDISIEQLANKIAAIVGFKNKIVWDTNKPDGQYRKILNADRMNKYNIKIKDSVSLDEGLKKTIQWYKEMLK